MVAGGKLRHRGAGGCRVLRGHTPPHTHTHTHNMHGAERDRVTDPILQMGTARHSAGDPSSPPQPCSVTPRHSVPLAGRGSPEPTSGCWTQTSTRMLDPNIWMGAPNLPVGAGPKASPGCRTPKHHTNAGLRSIAQALGPPLSLPRRCHRLRRRARHSGLAAKAGSEQQFGR